MRLDKQLDNLINEHGGVEKLTTKDCLNIRLSGIKAMILKNEKVVKLVEGFSKFILLFGGACEIVGVAHTVAGNNSGVHCLVAGALTIGAGIAGAAYGYHKNSEINNLKKDVAECEAQLKEFSADRRVL